HFPAIWTQFCCGLGAAVRQAPSETRCSASGEGGNAEAARPNATLSGRGLFRHDVVKRLARMTDTLGGTFLVMAKNASGRMGPYGRKML
ncbi:MAG: hypothetical protein QNJ94_21880, partial [Alphaproteobacteria bacterium]|nr:hypothetical protein [Alphaproteobacteria bacterium]